MPERKPGGMFTAGKRTDSVADSLGRMIEQTIREAIKYAWLRGAGAPTDVQVQPSKKRGATDAITFEVEARVGSSSSSTSRTRWRSDAGTASS